MTSNEIAEFIDANKVEVEVEGAWALGLCVD